MQLIENQPSLCIRILRVANSPYYGQRREVTTIQKAANLLGRDALRCIAAAAAVDGTMSRRLRTVLPDPAAFVAHSLATAAAAQSLALLISPGALFRCVHSRRHPQHRSRRSGMRRPGAYAVNHRGAPARKRPADPGAGVTVRRHIARGVRRMHSRLLAVTTQICRCGSAPSQSRSVRGARGCACDADQCRREARTLRRLRLLARAVDCGAKLTFRTANRYH